MKRLDTVLEQIVEEQDLTGELKQARLRNDWETIVESPFNQKVEPLRIEDSTLVLKAQQATWRQEANLLAPQITEAVNEHFGEPLIDDIRTVHG